MRTVLYATDYSENSLAALKMAEMLSKKLNRKLIVLHVFDINRVLISAVSLTSAKMEKKSFKDNREKLAAFCAKHINIKPSNKKLELVVDENPIPDESIREIAKKVKAEVIIVGTKGSSAIKEIIMGSTTKNLIDNSPCPVIAVPSIMDITNIETILYATDFEHADIWAIQFIVEHIAKPFNATIRVVHVSTKNDYAGEEQMEWFRGLLQEKILYKPMKFNIEFSEDVIKTLLEYSKKINANIVGMLERENNRIIKSLTHRDIVKLMVSKSTVPILSLSKENLIK